MTTAPFFHGSFTLKRRWRTTPARIFAAWSDPQLKAQWFSGPADSWTLHRRHIDFRVGGTEALEGRFNTSGLVTRFHARFHVIEPERRLVYSYDLFHGDVQHSVTLSSLLVEPDGPMTGISYTEQIVFLDGKDGTESRRHGTALQHDLLEKLLGGEGEVP